MKTFEEILQLAKDINTLAKRVLSEGIEGPKSTDPYLQAGRPCEVWTHNDCKCLFYYQGEDEKGHRWYMETYQKDTPTCYRRYNYKPIGTEWDFIPSWADKLYVNTDGRLTWSTENEHDRRERYVEIQTVLPKEYWGKTVQRPSWAK